MLEPRFHLDNTLFIFLRFLLVALSMYLFDGKARKNFCCCLNPLNTYKNTHTKLVTLALKQDAKFVKSHQ